LTSLPISIDSKLEKIYIVYKNIIFNDPLIDAGDPVCTHTMLGEIEEELLQNAKEWIHRRTME